MSINSYLELTESKMIISAEEKESINKSIGYLEKNLKEFFEREIVEQLQFGSSTRGTILPRKCDEKSDIDYMIIFNNYCDYKPQTFLNKLKDFAKSYYSRSEIYQDSPTIVLELNHIKFELVPAYKLHNICYIPNGKGGWMNTSPNDLNQLLVSANKDSNFMIKRVIRLIKYWNIKKNNRYFESYGLEKGLLEHLRYSYHYNNSYLDYVLDSFKYLKEKLFPFDAEFYRLEKIIKNINDAKLLEKIGQSDAALEIIKKIFPEV